MACLNIGGAIVCGDFGYGKAEAKIAYCPTCKKRRKFLRVHSTSAWYGPTDTCLTCGDKWAEGERLERGRYRGWRADSVAKAKARLKR